MALAGVHHILPLTTIIRERRLPIPGAVRVRAGQRVQPAEVVAEAAWAREHIFIDVARALGVSSAAADRLILHPGRGQCTRRPCDRQGRRPVAKVHPRAVGRQGARRRFGSDTHAGRGIAAGVARRDLGQSFVR